MIGACRSQLGSDRASLHESSSSRLDQPRVVLKNIEETTFLDLFTYKNDSFT